MNSSRLFFRVLFLVAALGLGYGIVAAQDRQSVIARMGQRLPAVDELKESKLVGENNRGYLEARGALNGAQQSIVSDENADRRALYESIAKEQGTNVEQVSRARAQKIAIGSKRGLWLQGNDSVWYQKP
jgi:uncharacterized protein YdbL (DUF1318 family)